MRHRNKTKTLGRKSAPRKALIRDLVTAMVTYDRIEVTVVKGKVARPVVEKMITIAKKGTLASRRQLLAYFTTDQPVNKLINVLAPRFMDRKGGFTRLTKLGTRQGDAAETALIEFV